MRLFFATVGVLAWIWSLCLLFVFTNHGGSDYFISAGIYAIVGILSLGCERIIKTLEDIRDGRTSADIVDEKNRRTVVVQTVR